MHLEPDSRPGESPVSGAHAGSARSGSSPAQSEPEHAAELRLIAEQAQMLTLASGAAIALRQGELMVCRASAGATAPDLGTPVDMQSGLSGECVRSGKVLVCADTETDSRVNLDVCRYLGIRSIAVLPIVMERELVGLFEAFAQQPGAFTANEVAALQSMCDLVISVIRSRPRAEAAPQAEVVAALSARAAGKPLEAWLSASLQEPADDLMCEIEQRMPPKSESEPLVRNLELVKGGRNGESVSAPGAAPPLKSPDPEDDLICELSLRPAFEPMPLPTGQERAHAFSAFTPAHDLPKEHTISRKLLVTGVVVVLAGLIWLGWCNHAQPSAQSGAPGSAVEAASSAAAAPISPGEPVSPNTSTAAEPDASSAGNRTDPAPGATPDDSSGVAAEESAARRVSPVIRRPRSATPSPGRSRQAKPAHVSGNSGRPASSALALASAAPPAAASGSERPAALLNQSSGASINLQGQQAPANPTASADQRPAASSQSFTLRPLPTPATASTGKLSLSQAVISAAPEAKIGVAAENNDVLRLLLRSAAAGDGEAQLALAVRFANGDGVRQSYPEAFKWFSRAQAQGVAARERRALEAWSRVQQWAQSAPAER